MTDDYIRREDAKIGLSKTFGRLNADIANYVIDKVEPADVVSKNDIAVLLDETVKEFTSGRKNSIADFFIVSVIGIVKCKIMMMGEE